MNIITIPQNAKIQSQFMIIHNVNVMYETIPSLIYEEILFSNGNNIYLSYSYKGERNILRQGIYGLTYLRNELINTLFNEKVLSDPYDTVIFDSIIKDYISKDMNINLSDLKIIKLYSSMNHNR